VVIGEIEPIIIFNIEQSKNWSIKRCMVLESYR